MYCRICKEHTHSCGHREPYLVYAAKRKEKFILIQLLSPRGRSYKHYKNAKGMKFDTCNEAVDWAWKERNTKEDVR